MSTTTIVALLAVFAGPALLVAWATRRLDIPAITGAFGLSVWLCALPAVVIAGIAADLIGASTQAAAVAIAVGAAVGYEGGRLALYRYVEPFRERWAWREAFVAGLATGAVECWQLGLRLAARAPMAAFDASSAPRELRTEIAASGVGVLDLVQVPLVLIGQLGFSVCIWGALAYRQPLLAVGALGAHLLVAGGLYAAPVVAPGQALVQLGPLAVWAALSVVVATRGWDAGLSAEAAAEEAG